MSINLAPLNLDGIPETPVSRIAPTPSGFLHLGNAVNFLVTWVLVRSRGGVLHLRIDDMDGIRFRQDVLEDIFSSLEWLGLDWDLGPQGPDEFHDRFSLQARREVYRSHLKDLEDQGHAFTCICSRKQIKMASSNGLYHGTCRSAGHAFTPGKNAVRLRVDGGTEVAVHGNRVRLDETFGDFVLWRRDDQPSYQLASLVEDREAGSTLIVRGRDLFLSTAAQIYLSQCLGFDAFARTRFLHHDLVMGSDDEKLSKSRGAYALKDMRESGQGPEAAFSAAARVLGLPPKGMASVLDLLRAFKTA